MNRIIARNFRYVNFRYTNNRHQKMCTLELVVENNKRSQEIIKCLKNELTAIRTELINRKKQALITENRSLQKQLELAKAQLIALEIKNDKKQIPVPGSRNLCTDEKATSAPSVAGDATENKNPKEPKEKQNKGNKPKKEKSAESALDKKSAELPIDIRRLDMRVGKIIEVSRHPDADGLYLEKIDCGEAQPRTVVSGLVKFVPIEEMENRMLVVLCNLKSSKIRGTVSEAMVMCASTPEKVEVLSPPEGSEPGDLVHCEGFPRQPDAQLNPKKKIFEICAPDLKTNDSLVACYKDSALYVPGKGNVVAQTLKNVQIK